MRKKGGPGKFKVCQISIYSERLRIRIEGDYVKEFYEQLKIMIPGKNRAWVELERHWLVDRSFFSRIFELAYQYFDKIFLIENGRVEEYFPHGEQKGGN